MKRRQYLTAGAAGASLLVMVVMGGAFFSCATPPPAEVKLNWRTESERDNYGFYVKRSQSPEGPFERVNEKIIAGHGTTNSPSEYEYVDYDVDFGKTYYYSLYTVSYNGDEELLYTIAHEVKKGDNKKSTQ